MGRLTARFLMTALALGGVADDGVAQQRSQPAFQELVDRVRTGPISLGALIQVVADAPFEESADVGGFGIANARVRLYGSLDAGFDYLIQANLAASPALLDARIGYQRGESLRLDAGRFKTPFSRELLIPAANIDFIDRARVVQALAPGRQLGVQASAGLGRFDTGIGVFTGGDNARATEEAVLVAGRVSGPIIEPAEEGGLLLDLGLNAAYGGDETVPLLDGTGEGVLLGADLVLTAGRLKLTGEAIGARISAEGGAEAEPVGFQATAAWFAADRVQLLGRADYVELESGAGDLAMLLGVNIWPTLPTELQVNYVLPIDGELTVHRLLVNFQVAF